MSDDVLWRGTIAGRPARVRGTALEALAVGGRTERWQTVQGEAAVMASDLARELADARRLLEAERERVAQLEARHDQVVCELARFDGLPCDFGEFDRNEMPMLLAYLSGRIEDCADYEPIDVEEVMRDAD